MIKAVTTANYKVRMMFIASPVKTWWQLTVIEQDLMRLNKYRINVLRTLSLTSVRFN